MKAPKVGDILIYGMNEIGIIKNIASDGIATVVNGKNSILVASIEFIEVLPATTESYKIIKNLNMIK